MLKLALAQINPTVGDLAGNSQKILQNIQDAQAKGADLVVFPELCLCGYPPEDLLWKGHFVERNIKVLHTLAQKVHGISAIVGFVDSDGRGKLYNAAALLADGAVKEVYHKRELPNYGVFDEKRYFTPGTNKGLADIKGVRVGISICEDIWVDGSVHTEQAGAGARVLINISSSPYEAGKLGVRHDLLRRRAREHRCFAAYVNMIGGQDELVFDGGSFVVSPTGEFLGGAVQFREELLILRLEEPAGKTASAAVQEPGIPMMDPDAEIYQALVLGTRDYVRKNGFTNVVLGLSGGVDSALVAAIAADAVGSDHVTAISMPTQFNSKATRADARTVARNLGIEFLEIPIKGIFKQYLKGLGKWFAGTGPDMAEENIQARIRGTVLMAFANKFGRMVLTTGNKSEMAVGYCTLYGDMNGGFAPLKDIFKTKVYALCRWRNSGAKNPPIPKTVLMRAPTAELRANQTDEESLGAYEDLDKVLSAYVERHQSIDQIAGEALPAAYVQKTIRLVDTNEYKRRQSPPGVKITPRAFGKDWRLPITNKYRE